MKFWLVFVAIQYLFFVCGRLLWPNPDGTVESKNKQAFCEMLDAARGYSGRALLHKICLPLVLLFYFPFYKPGAGFLVAAALLGLASVI